MNVMPAFNADLLQRHDRPGPRYTSYPSAPQFNANFGVAQLRELRSIAMCFDAYLDGSQPAIAALSFSKAV